MLEVEIPGRATLRFDHAVFDLNGTIAVDGRIPLELHPKLAELRKKLALHVLTADTYGTVAEQCTPLGFKIHSFPQGCAAQAKAEIAQALVGGIVCFGNGFNDVDMFKCADLAIAVCGEEGLYAGLLTCADVVVPSPSAALDLLLKPNRLRATLRA